MEEFLKEVMGKKVLITFGDSDFAINIEGKITGVRDKYFIYGENNLLLSINDMCKITKEDDEWIIDTSKNTNIIVTLLDKIR